MDGKSTSSIRVTMCKLKLPLSKGRKSYLVTELCSDRRARLGSFASGTKCGCEVSASSPCPSLDATPAPDLDRISGQRADAGWFRPSRLYTVGWSSVYSTCSARTLGTPCGQPRAEEVSPQGVLTERVSPSPGHVT